MNSETSGQAGLIRALSFPLYNCKGWMKFIGVMSIISGVIPALTIVGILFAWLPILTGVLLFQSANAIGNAYEADSQAGLMRSLSKLKTYFIITGVLTLIGIIVTVLMLCFCVFGMCFAALSQH